MSMTASRSSSRSIRRVLVVDDEESIRTFVEGVLTLEGYGVVTATDGPDALSIIGRTGLFDLYLLDVVMPLMFGDELARQIRRTDPDAKILYFTGCVDKLFEHRPVLWENEAFVEKPVTLDGLLQAVSLMLTGKIERFPSSRV